MKSRTVQGWEVSVKVLGKMMLMTVTTYRASAASDDGVKGQGLGNTVGHAAAAGLDGCIDRLSPVFGVGGRGSAGTRSSLRAAIR